MAETAVKRYLLFTYEDYYPSGGWGDFKGSFDSPEEAMAAAVKINDGNADLVDRETLTEVEDFNFWKARQAWFANQPGRIIASGVPHAAKGPQIRELE